MWIILLAASSQPIMASEFHGFRPHLQWRARSGFSPLSLLCPESGAEMLLDRFVIIIVTTQVDRLKAVRKSE